MALQRLAVMPSMFGVGSACSIGTEIAGLGVPLSSSGSGIGTANTAVYVPLEVTETITIVKGWWCNDAGISGNVDIGLYPEAGGAKLVSLGSTAQAGADLVQEGNIADTVVPPGRYLMAFAVSSATSDQEGWVLSTSSGRSLGLAMEAVFPLPASATPAAFSGATVLIVPSFGFSQRTLVA